jgi:hypothetical protein
MAAFKSPRPESRLVTLHPGKYWKVGAPEHSNDIRVTIREPTNALLLEFQGYHQYEVEAWHALVHGHVLLVWESNFNRGM